MLASRLAAALALSLAVPAWSQPAAVTVELRNFGYSPSVIRLPAGKPVTLTFVNRSGGAHDFTAKSFFARSRIVAGDSSGGEIELKGAQTRSITLVPVAGRYKVHCGHFMHKQFGMTGEILVQ
jgi:plastocyanin